MMMDRTKLVWTPKPLWTPEQLRQRNTALVIESHWGLEASIARNEWGKSTAIKTLGV
jgi:hypothetical protein